MTKKKSNQGLSIIEVVFAILLIFLLLSGLTAAMIFTIKAARFSRNKSIGIQIAKQELENIKKQRSKDGTNWWSGKGTAGQSCEDMTSMLINYPQFKKKTCYENYNDENLPKKQVTATVYVYWGSDDQEVAKLSIVLTNWEQ